MSLRFGTHSAMLGYSFRVVPPRPAAGAGYLMLTAPPRGSGRGRGTWLVRASGVVTSVCVSPRNACLVPLRRREQVLPGPMPGVMACRRRASTARA